MVDGGLAPHGVGGAKILKGVFPQDQAISLDAIYKAHGV
jgi:hypothetical protein